MDARELRDALVAEGERWTELRRELNGLRRAGKNPRASALKREVKAQHMRVKKAVKKLDVPRVEP